MSILDTFSLHGKVALITGANRGLGRAMAAGLAEAGADIVGLNRGPDPGPIHEQVMSLGQRFMHTQCDLGQASVEQLQQVVDRIVFDMGRLDILVNNAGIIQRKPTIEVTEADWDAVLQVNLKALFFLSQAVARVMLKQGGGKIIHTASLLSFQGGILVPAYSAAKHGIAGITKAMANEWASHNINVNAIAPGYIRTDMTEALQDDQERNQAILDRIPAGRWGEADELKGITVFLASEAANYLHGTIVPVDGAWLAR